MGASPYDALRLLVDLKEKKDTTELPFDGRAGDALARFSRMLDDFIEKSQNTNLVDLFDFVVESSNYKQFTLNDPDGGRAVEISWNCVPCAAVPRPLSPESLAAFLESVALVSDVDGYDKIRSGNADYLTPGQRTGVSGGLHRRRRRKVAAAHAVDGRSRPAGRRAASFLCRDYARQEAHLSFTCFPPCVNGQSHDQSAFAFSGGYSQKPDYYAGMVAGEETKVADAVYSWNRVRVDNTENKKERK